MLYHPMMAELYIIKYQNNTQAFWLDILDKEKLCHSIKDHQPDYVFHLAAQALVRKAYQFPTETFDVNVSGTANILHALRTIKHTCSVVVITTDKVYENREIDILYKENDRLGGYDPYSGSKACAEIVVDSFRNSFYNLSKIGTHQIAISSARAGNVIGGGDWNTDRLMPDIIQALQNSRSINIRNPYSVRPGNMCWNLLQGIYSWVHNCSKTHMLFQNHLISDRKKMIILL